MAVTVDDSAAPWVHAYGTTAEVLAHLKAQNVAAGDVIAIWYNGTNTSVVYRR